MTEVVILRRSGELVIGSLVKDLIINSHINKAFIDEVAFDKCDKKFKDETGGLSKYMF